MPMRRIFSLDMRFQRSSSQTIALTTLPQRVKGVSIQDPDLKYLRAKLLLLEDHAVELPVASSGSRVRNRVSRKV